VSTDVALLASAVLLVTAATALFSKKISVSLIMLFYSSLTLGLIFTLYGSILVGLLHIITFAGAVSVLMLTSFLMTGESKMEVKTGASVAAVLGGILVVAVVAAYELLAGLPSTAAAAVPPPTELFQFIWQFRPWDLLILLMVFASSMIVVVNLFSKESVA
jgi:NADH:ubiquinone oxidoreductase subunit 6 (subunit J)